MSAPRPSADELTGRASVFAALGDATRLALVATLLAGEPRSISQLAHRSPLTRQAITKHLRVLQGAGIVEGVRVGRERRFQLCPEPLQQAQSYLEQVALQWQAALVRLRAFVED
jgi:DNA-binding transcriptional ArsR family regulator